MDESVYVVGSRLSWLRRVRRAMTRGGRWQIEKAMSETESRDLAVVLVLVVWVVALPIEWWVQGWGGVLSFLTGFWIAGVMAQIRVE